MEEMRSNQVMTCQKLDVKPYQYDEGIAGIATLYQNVGLAVNKIPPGLYKRVLSAAVLQKVEYVIRMKTLEEYRDHPSYQGLRDEQIEQIILEDTKVHHVNGKDIAPRQVYGKTIGLSTGCIFAIWHVRTILIKGYFLSNLLQSRRLKFERITSTQWI